MTKKNADEKNRWVGSAVFRCRDKQKAMAYKNRAMCTVRWREGGVLSIKKKIQQTPLSIFDVMNGVEFVFQKIMYNIVKYCTYSIICLVRLLFCEVMKTICVFKCRLC